MGAFQRQRISVAAIVALAGCGAGTAPKPRAAAGRHVFDPVGDELDHNGQRPVRRPGYGVDPARIVIARGLIGSRRQEDFAVDPDKRRLVEEIRVEIENRTGRAAAIEVREHLYRGRDWAIAYHNQVGRLRKAGPQEIRFALEVPPRSRRLIAYRVVYRW
jgi:hypothetical protein